MYLNSRDSRKTGANYILLLFSGFEIPLDAIRAIFQPREYFVAVSKVSVGPSKRVAILARQKRRLN